MKKKNKINVNFGDTIQITETSKIWNNYYKEKKPNQIYPDENLVRIITPLIKEKPFLKNAALDFGCGGGRHLLFLKDIGFKKIFAYDFSQSALKNISKKYKFVKTINYENDFWLEKVNTNDINKNKKHTFLSPPPLPDNSLNIVLAWGVLHYNSFDVIQKILNEIKRILKKNNSYFIGTVRANTDTHLSINKDIKFKNILYFDDKSLTKLLKPHFKKISLGYIERSLLGDLNKKICHYIFVAEM